MEELYFSVIDEETGEERLYCVNEVLSEEEYLERIYSECYEEERTFASIRNAKKIGKLVNNEIIKSEGGLPSRRAIGQIMARADRAGLGKNQIKNISGKGYDKVLRGSAAQMMKYAKKNGVTVDKKELAGILQGAKDSALSQAKQAISSSGKRAPLSTIY